MTPDTAWLGQSFHCEGWRDEMASRIASFDWSDTAMGPIDRWSKSLRAAVKLMHRKAFRPGKCHLLHTNPSQLASSNNTVSWRTCSVFP